MFSLFSMFPRFPGCLRFTGCPALSGFPCFPSFPSFPFTAFPGSVAGARLTAFPEVRFMRCAVHGSNLNTMRVPAQLSEKPSYQRWTRLQPMVETLTKSEYDRALAPSEFWADRARLGTGRVKLLGRPRPPLQRHDFRRGGSKPKQWHRHGETFKPTARALAPARGDL